MEIILDNISKKFGNQWVIKNLSFHFREHHKYAVIGANGSGKSTLLQIIISKIPFSKGKLQYFKSQNTEISPQDIYKHVTIATTAMNLIEEFTLNELLDFHFQFKKPIIDGSRKEILKIIQLENEGKKLISNFSSGMKQRLKIGLALLTDSDIVIFDEPGANLDEAAKLWYHELIEKYLNNRMLIVASNEITDYKMCSEYVNLGDYK